MGSELSSFLSNTSIETHLVVSRSAEITIGYEVETKLTKIKELANVNHAVNNIGSSISSGSFKTIGMLILPCSIRTMSEIATGVTGSLLTRAADVVLKERRQLVLAIRETPLHTGHLRTMTSLSEMGTASYRLLFQHSTISRRL